MPSKGDAAFRYNAGAGVVTVRLQWPLFRVTPANSATRFEAWSLDGSSKEVVKVGSGYPEIRGTIRFHPDGIELVDLLAAGADGHTLTYYPSLAAGTGYPCLLVEPSGRTLEALRDSSARGRLGEHEVAVRLRRVDGGTFAGLFS